MSRYRCICAAAPNRSCQSVRVLGCAGVFPFRRRLRARLYPFCRTSGRRMMMTKMTIHQPTRPPSDADIVCREQPAHSIHPTYVRCSPAKLSRCDFGERVLCFGCCFLLRCDTQYHSRITTKVSPRFDRPPPPLAPHEVASHGAVALGPRRHKTRSACVRGKRKKIDSSWPSLPWGGLGMRKICVVYMDLPATC